MKLEIHKESPVRLPVSKINRLLEMIKEGEGDSSWSAKINIILTDDKQLRELNRDFRGKDSTTDILSFNIDSPDDPIGVFGELYISTDRVQIQAAEYGYTETEEYLRLICHGFLHLCGYDHEMKSDEKIMFSKQDHYIDQLKSLT